ncbi:hypothetical protein [Paraburkholderia ultramafica]|uniref:hypothetical protein n=1 Tax=Paraburkholderia ultramafica TaxID=1544867 RepID=UPI003CCCE1B1
MDELATHHHIDSLGLEEVVVTSIDHDTILLEASDLCHDIFCLINRESPPLAQ